MASELEALAKRCDEMAAKAEHEIAARLARPISQSA
jgi:hypothetical protein